MSLQYEQRKVEQTQSVRFVVCDGCGKRHELPRQQGLTVDTSTTALFINSYGYGSKSCPHQDDMIPGGLRLLDTDGKVSRDFCGGPCAGKWAANPSNYLSL